MGERASGQGKNVAEIGSSERIEGPTTARPCFYVDGAWRLEADGVRLLAAVLAIEQSEGNGRIQS